MCAAVSDDWLGVWDVSYECEGCLKVGWLSGGIWW